MKNNKLSYAIAILFFVLGCYYAFLFKRYLDENRFVPIAKGENVYIYDHKNKVFFMPYSRKGYMMLPSQEKYFEPKDLK